YASRESESADFRGRKEATALREAHVDDIARTRGDVALEVGGTTDTFVGDHDCSAFSDPPHPVQVVRCHWLFDDVNADRRELLGFLDRLVGRPAGVRVDADLDVLR